MLKKIFIILFIFLISKICLAYEKSDAFVIKVFDEVVKVLAPAKHHPKLNVIIDNKTLIGLLGKIETDKGRIIDFVSIPSRKSKSVELITEKGERVFFVPMAPAFQRIELIIGKKSYEIPPKR